jgi:3-phosphoshikimate 1-carboxyvinyltransferase
MGKRWVSRWGPTQAGEKGSLVPVLSVQKSTSIETVQWRLPPSKSHAIRWLALAAQSKQSVVLENMANAGQDAVSMRRCLVQMGVAITDIDHAGQLLSVPPNHDDQPHPEGVAWRVDGVGPAGLQPPVSVLHAGNSGTALRILMALASQFRVPVMLDGDASLRSRSYATMLECMDQLGVSCSYGVEQEGLPVLLQGPFDEGVALKVDARRSSQPTSAWLLATPSFPQSVTWSIEGQPVSQRHAELTRALCEATGANGLDSGVLLPWTPVFSDSGVEIPPDASMLAFAFLATRALNCIVEVEALPSPSESLGHEILFEYAEALGVDVRGRALGFSSSNQHLEVDLRNANDLITPLAALMALGGGGLIKGAHHAAFKETNRLTGSAAFLEQFGLTAEATEDGLSVVGGQQLTRPQGLVKTFGDHRMMLTALVLASAVDGKTIIEGQDLHAVADPQAVERLQAAGVTVEHDLHQPW